MQRLRNTALNPNSTLMCKLTWSYSSLSLFSLVSDHTLHCSLHSSHACRILSSLNRPSQSVLRTLLLTNPRFPFWNVLLPKLCTAASFSAFRSLFKCHLLKESFCNHLSEVTASIFPCECLSHHHLLHLCIWHSLNLPCLGCCPLRMQAPGGGERSSS